MIGNRHKLKVDRDDIVEKWNCFSFSSSAHIENIKWALYEFDAPDFYATNEEDSTDIFLHIGNNDKGIEWQKCIFVGNMKADYVIPDEIANKFDSLVQESIRSHFENTNVGEWYYRVQLNKLISFMMDEVWKTLF